MTEKRRKVFVALSGGVDSSVAAALFKYGVFHAQSGSASGWDVRGIHIKMWSDPKIPCTTKEDRYDAMRVAAKLNIPFETWDFTKEYKRAVIDYMIQEYAAGRTPNPDVMCNRRIKFGAFLERALANGADYVATGHYVRLMRKPETRNPKSETISKSKNQNPKHVLNLEFVSNFDIRASNFSLHAAKDLSKDQSYFLWTLTQEQLRHCLFPIGEYTKTEVRGLAKKFGLPTAEKKDSQGLCFIGKIDVREFLKTRIPEKRGVVITTSGKKVGEHNGLMFHTIGQRRGLAIGGGTPYYVAEKDFAANTLVVAENKNDPRLNQKSLAAGEINWILDPAPKLPLRCKARIRYRQPLQRCTLTYADDTRTHAGTNYSAPIHVQFDKPQRAVTPGQSIVFYKDAEMLGGGVIR